MSEFFHAIILLTLACQCRCRYCYENHLDNSNMPHWVRQAIKMNLERRVKRGLKNLAIEFFGGEPLLQSKTLLDIADFAKQTMKSLGGKFQGSVTTNGLLLNQSFHDLLKSGVNQFQITLDGLEHAHDSWRFTASGHGTFNTIWDNLIMMRDTKYEFFVTLRVHLRKGEVQETENLIREIQKIFGNDKRFAILFHSIRTLGGQFDNHLPVFASQEEAITSLSDFSKKAGETILPYYCYAASPNSLVFLPDGKISKCTVSLEKGVIGQINENGSLTIDSKLLSLWCVGHLTADTEALGCIRSILIKQGVSC